MTDEQPAAAEVPVARGARVRYDFDGTLLADPVNPAALAAARQLARLMAEGRDAGSPSPPSARQLQAMALIHEAMRRVVEARTGGPGAAFSSDALGALETQVGAEPVEEALRAYGTEFPIGEVFRGKVGVDAFLEGTTDGRANRELVLRDLLLLWLSNRNPAFTRHGELFDDWPVARASLYSEIVEALRRYLGQEGRGDDLVAQLLAPAQAAPDSLADQLRFIGQHWPEARDLVDGLGAGLDRLADTERGVAVEDDDLATPAFGLGGAGPPDAGALHGFAGLDAEIESYSRDDDWMPRTVLLAKSTYVWLDQLSRRFGYPIRTLDAIPDEELDTIAARGFTGLWLIGVWERSVASQRIKQMRGNPEAVASAYSLMDYRISDDLGGEDAFAALRESALARGIRLACDMVPNHMGIDSRWVVERPELFISRAQAPFPAYTYDGPNLSSDERVGIYLEDHYADGSDAAVVFKRVDRWSGEERYIYHGNDGTGTPWNDTAQLDFLRPDVREAVIENVLAVARRAPIIRFDAAMTLARRHVQRLWYPLPGTGEAIASRADSALPATAFAERMPTEFWREVVDRVAAEVPGTLLLAEAFWLMEGYFVRTLGMHRVYNSAFMHMLRDEDNAGYRKVLRNTLEFDPEILKRYVNFMSNPDERTAIDQFGDGEKYFGVATLLATLPGLPMFGHGQVEGFGERYGMEFRRALLDEQPNSHLIERHEREVVPLLHMRERFAEAHDFRLYDFVGPHGSVDEDVFAYSNLAGERRSLVVYLNAYREVEGRIHDSVPASVAGGDSERAPRSQPLAQALGLPAEPDAWLVLRDERSSQEWLQSCLVVHEAGLALRLHAYECRVLLDPVVRWDGPRRELARLRDRIGDGAVRDIDVAIAELVLAPQREAVYRLFDSEAFRRVAGAAIGRDDALVEMTIAAECERVALETRRLAEALDRYGAEAGPVARFESRLRGLIRIVREGRGKEVDGSRAQVSRWLATDRRRWTVLLGWLYADVVADVLDASAGEAADDAGWQERDGLVDGLRAVGEGIRLTEAEREAAVRLSLALVAGERTDDPELEAAIAARDLVRDAAHERAIANG